MQIMSVVSIFVLVLLGFSTIGTSVSSLTMQYIGLECVCGVAMGLLSVVSIRFAFGGRYGRAATILFVGFAMEGVMLFLVSRTQVLTSAQVGDVILGLHGVCAVTLASFGLLWQQTCSKVGYRVCAGSRIFLGRLSTSFLYGRVSRE